MVKGLTFFDIIYLIIIFIVFIFIVNKYLFNGIQEKFITPLIVKLQNNHQEASESNGDVLKNYADLDYHDNTTLQNKAEIRKLLVKYYNKSFLLEDK